MAEEEQDATAGEGAAGDDGDAMADEWAAMLENEGGGGDGGGGGGDVAGQDDLADEWAAMVDEPVGEDDERPAVERVLNQDDIDSLLGFSIDNDDQGEGGIRAIINSTLVSYERLPMLEIVFDRLVRLMTSSLRTFTTDNVEVSLDNITSVRFGDYLNSIPLPAVLSVFKAEEWDNFGLFTIDSALIYSIVDVLLGGRRSPTRTRVDGRPYTTIEMGLVERMVEVILQDAQTAFEPLSAVSLSLDRLETNPRFAAIARPANVAILVKLRIDMEDRGGKIEMLLPYATLEPIRELLLQRFMGEKFGRDAIWETHLANEMWTTRVQLDAVLDEQKLPLKDAMQFEVGQTLMLNCSSKDPIDLRCGGVGLLQGQMGRVGDRVAVRVTQAVRPRRSGASLQIGAGEELELT